jgi:hypothetical protein
MGYCGNFCDAVLESSTDVTIRAGPERSIQDRAADGSVRRTYEVIIETGLCILDNDGLAALIMRRVAQDLDTGAASL